jgi:hypothetical protein
MNLSNVTNRIRAVPATREAPYRLAPAPAAAHGVVPPRRRLSSAPLPSGTDVWRLRLEGNAWFNLYMVGAGSQDLAGPLSLMHVK